ncbi:MAG: choice-of-anchor D domain-containing protein, partial [Candidatus Acidiferrales bacterium]
MRRIASLVVITLASACSVAAQAPTAASKALADRAAHKQAAAPRHDPASAPAPHANGAYGNVPLSFEANRGQTDARVKYLARGKGYTLFLTPTQEVLALRRVITSPEKPKQIADPKAPQKYSETVLEFNLEGANPQAEISGTDLLPGISNYYIGNDPAKWRAGIPNYGKVLYRNTYPGIDLTYYGNQGQLESDFIVAPGADPHEIRLRVQGAKALQIAETGDLIVALEAGSIKLQQPVAYQIIHGVRREVSSGYTLLAADEVGITLAPYDHRQKLIIDPTLSYSTYLGGSNGQSGTYASDVAVDSAGEAYVIGATSSTDFPTKAGFQGNLGSGATQNAFVTKFSADGTSLIFSTYIGGGYFDSGYGIAVDTAGSAYAVGNTLSSNFPLQNPLSGQNQFSGDGCGFASSLSSAGALLFSTYLCGGTSDAALGVAVDSNKNVYIVGLTTSTSFPTQNPIQPTLAGKENAFILKLAPITGTGSSLVFSTYFGGNGSDYGTGIALDSSNDVYISGSTNSTVFATKNAIQANLNAKNGGSNGFVAEVNSAGTAVVYSTYLGGSVNDYANDVAADSSGNAYVTGGATSPDFPLKNSLQTLDAGGDIFVTKIAAGGGSLDFSTLFGGGGEGSGYIALDSSNNIYVSGYTTASDFPTRLPLQATLNGQQAGFLTELKSDGSDYTFSTYLGGSDSVAGASDAAYGVALDASNNIYVVGQASTLDFPTVKPFQAGLNNPVSSGFVLKIAPATPAAAQLFPAALNFGSVQTGTSSTEVVTLANGTNALDISSIAVSGPDAADFSDFSTCGATVPPTIVCTFTVTFTPSTTGTETATVTITESSGTQSFTLSGTGATNTPPTLGTITVNPTGLTFGSQEVGSTSAEQFVTVNVTGTNPVGLNFPGTAGADPADFSANGDGTCEFDTPLSAGTSCTIGVTFDPTATGTRTATLQITGNITTNPVNVMLTGTGTPQIAVLTPTFIQFPNTVVNTTSAAMMATLKNMSSTVTLTAINPTVTSFLPSGSFAISATTCPIGAGLAPGASCTISVTYTAISAGIAEGELSVSDSDAGTSPQTSILFGTGLNATATLATISPTYLAFGRQTVGTTSNAPYVFLQNIGNSTLTFTTPLSGTNPAAFAAANTCGGSIPAGGTCEATVTFTPPSGPAPFFATLTISSAAAGAPQTVALSGTGIPGTTVSLLPNPLIFPAVSVGQASAPEYAFLNNTGTTADTITGMTITGTDFDDFQLSFSAPGNTPCNTTQVLNAQAVCVVGVAFTPTTTGLRTATLTVTDTATGTPHSIPLEGGSAIAPLQITTSSPLPGASVGVLYSATLAATGGTPPYSWSFSSGTLPPGLTVGSTGTITGTPTTAGPYSFTVQVTDSMSPTPNTAMATFGLTVTGSTGGALTILPTSLPDGEVTLPYGATIVASGGTPPYTYAVTTGTITSGLTLNGTTGQISGFPSCCTPATFTVTATDSASNKATQSYTITVQTAPTGAGNSLLNGYYAIEFHTFNEATGQEEGIVGSLNFNSSGDFTGEVDYNFNGQTAQGVSVGGSYVVGPDNRGIMNFQLPSGTFQYFVLAVGNTYRGVASSAAITNFADDTGTGNIGSGQLILQTLESNYLTTFPGTYAFGGTGLDPTPAREAQVGLIAFNATNGVTSGAADINDAGTQSSITAITGTYTTPDQFGRTVLTLNLTPGGSSSRSAYIVSPNQFVWLTLDSPATNPILVGSALRQTTPGNFSASSITGPDVFILNGRSKSGLGNDAVVGVATASSGTITVTFDEDDAGSLLGDQTLSGTLTVLANGRASAPLGSQTWIAYLASPDQAFSLGTGSGVVAGDLIPQVGAPFSTAPFNGNFSFGSLEPVSAAAPQWSGVAALTGTNTFNVTEDLSEPGGQLFYDQNLGAVTFTVASSGHLTAPNTALNGSNTGYMVSPYQVVLFNPTGPTPGSKASVHPVIVDAFSQTAAPGTPSPAAPSVNFPTPVAAGASATSALVTITNTGIGPLGFTGVNTGNSPDFSAAGACVPVGTGAVAVVQPLSSCTFTVTFAPPAGAASGAVSETLILTTDGTSNVTVAVSGTVGGASGPAVTLAPTSLTFASQSVGTTSAAQSVMLTNSGTAALTISGITVTGTNNGDFAQTNTCPASLAAAANCSISVTFTPTAAGGRSASISIADNATGSPQTVPLTGTGASTTPAVTVSPASLTFASEIVGTTSSPMSVTVTNTSTATVNFSGFTVTGTNAGDFGVPLPNSVTMCSPTGTLAGGAYCQINVLFTPATSGTRTATLNVADNATGSPQKVTLTGTGAAQAGTISIAPTSLTFVSQTVGTTSSSQTLTVSNTGGVTVNFSSIVTSGDFAGATTAQCPSIAVEGTPCTFQITFKPTAAGTRTGAVTFTDNATGSPQMVMLTGTGANGPATVTVAPNSLMFSSQYVNST